MSTPTAIDTLIDGAVVVTMDAGRTVYRDGAIAITGSRITAIGSAQEIRQGVAPRTVIDGTGFVATPGMVNTHIHITGEPLTRGFVPDDTPFEENVFVWLCPLYAAHRESDERLSAQLAAAEMLKSGTTTFLEAGTVRFVDAVVDGLEEIGIRGRIGQWVWDLPPEPTAYQRTTDRALTALEKVLDDHAGDADSLIRSWSMIVGHTTCTDELWRGAKAAADRHGTGMSFHMSPAAMDPEAFTARFGQRPMEHLAELGILDRNVVIAHCVHVNDAEVNLLAHHHCSVAHCPTTALKVAYGITQIGRMPEMVDAGVNVCIGTDGNNASNYSDMMRATYLVAGLFKDARRDATMFPAEEAYEMATLGGSRALLLEDDIGSLEVGKRADIVLHDRARPEWTPLHNVANQLVYSADGRGVHSVFVDGRRLVDNYRLTTVDERALYAAAQTAGEAVVRRSGLPDKSKWRMV